MSILENNTHKDAQKLLLEGYDIRKRIETIKLSIIKGVSKEVALENQAMEHEINSSLETLTQMQKILAERTDLDEETFVKELDSFGSNYRKVISYLAHKYGMSVVDELIRKQQEDTVQK